MYKVIIIDDEIWISQLIEKLIDWEKLQMEVIGISNDGETGFKLIKQTNPHIVITDIRMPGMDGLELISRVNDNKLNTNFIIISGYQDFSYAQKAIKYGVNNYITKPIEEDELFDTLKKIKNKLKQEVEKDLEEQALKNKLSTSVDLLRNKFLSDLVVGNNKINNIQTNNDNILNFTGSLFQIVIFRVDTRSNFKINMDHRTLFYEQLVKIIDKIEEHINIIAHTNKIICIFNYNQDEQINIKNRINYIFESLKNNLINITHKIFITCAVGSVEHDISKLNNSYCLAEKVMRTRVVLGTNRIITMEEYNAFDTLNIKDILSTERVKQYVCQIELFDTEKLKEWIVDSFNVLTQNGNNVNPALLIDISLKIINITQKELDNLNINSKYNYNIEEIKDMLDECLTIEEIIDKVVQIVSGIIEDNRHINNLDGRKPIEIAKEYISKHYNENISLQELSEKVYLNPTYLSELFKKEVGVNFSDYIINHRIEIARELLQNPKHKISDVSRMIGYNDSRYFSKLFKKIIGVTPKQFRKLYI